MPADQNRKSDSQTVHSLSVPASQAQNASGGILCQVCHYLIPSEQIGRKPLCRRCGYLES